MIVGFSFRAKPGKAQDLERLLSDPDAGLRMAKAMGASRNLLLWQGDRMVRILEFPEGTRPTPLAEVAAKDPQAREFIRRVGELAEPGFDIDEPETLDAFNREVALRVVFDARP